MKILVIGGNRFFGKKLVKRLLKNKDQVTLLNRGSRDDGFGNEVGRIICDRNDSVRMAELLKDQEWDLVYDQVCFDYIQARDICNILKNKTKKLIFTSTVSVYRYGRYQKEESYNPSSYKMVDIVKSEDNYGEAKMQAEFAFYKYADFPVISPRFPIVWGEDDWTQRLDKHIKTIQSGKTMSMPNLDAHMSFITSGSAADALFKLGTCNHEGSINIACSNDLRLRTFVKTIEDTFKIRLNLSHAKIADYKSEYGIEEDWSIDCSLMDDFNIETKNVHEWLKEYLESDWLKTITNPQAP